jgi:prepilin-type N-terminal cleavage/methylation domain-containing protein
MGRHVRRAQRGFTLAEALVVIVMIGIMLAIVAPRFRMSHAARVRGAARQLAVDLETVRTRALSTTTMVRMAFNAGAGSYTGYFDNDRNGAFAQTVAENTALVVFRTRVLTDGVRINRAGGIPDVPGMAGAGAITLPGSRIEFGTMGITNPFGTQGVVYLNSSNDATAVAAVSISAAAGIRVWVYRGGVWQ